MKILNNQQKAELYNKYLFQYQRIQEEIRQIKANNFELSEREQNKVNLLEARAKQIYNMTEKLYR